ncbi:helix-turn-helix transcriptional regulator [Mucilaginibacter robiniae]|uniref:Helix-turn-helix transcriptional regulator n=1 Tax=Mucilaginibacter robiniae TaxID=2728022 RepID=A0A7L5DXY7_9SPHI|nr:helix-turn-helix transcriptional regulator [Mucilaginibacter robiniae]QJD95631.1 helix-turn-helix transcriptional regulator [Mucilaginibacter robiniae]
MEKHYGQVIEKVIRRNGYSISELAQMMNVNRRSIYNWFEQRRLKAEVISRMGEVLKYDFSNEFPELFSPETFAKDGAAKAIHKDGEANGETPAEISWKDKYISLLEKYNDLLVKKLS